MSIHFDNFDAVRDNVTVDHMTRCDIFCVRRIPEDIKMADGPKQRSEDVRADAQESVQELASRVLTLVASKSQTLRATLRDDLVEHLITVVQTPGEAGRADLTKVFRDAGIPNEDVIDLYIPAAARIMGERWCSDTMGFAEVTIGSSRLQALLRDLERPVTPNANASNVIAIVAEDAFHTLGVMVLASQLRRIGLHVHTAIGRPNAETVQTVAKGDFDVVMISASGSERLETIRNLVNSLRNGMRRKIPIVVGGYLTLQHDNVKFLTGADYVANDPKEALKKCGLTIPIPDGAPRVLQD